MTRFQHFSVTILDQKDLGTLIGFYISCFSLSLSFIWYSHVEESALV